MSEVKRFDVPSMRSLTQGEQAVMGYEVVLASDYDALAAEAQALREEVARGNRIAWAMALDIASVGVALGIPGEQQEGGTGEFIEAIQNLQKELEALRARVMVVPDMRLWSGIAPAHIRHYVKGWNTCLDEVARLNGLTVSEGLLRRLARPADRYDEVFTLDRHEAAEELRALLSEQA
ncbi:TPA: hypothetical protein N2B14_001901 [Pseudomonas aeruginosa]|nr:hypothetical protein [Pseudomonas aeruginosa]